jgi:hypothetical protein
LLFSKWINLCRCAGEENVHTDEELEKEGFSPEM